jgi:hypothetical protein
MGLLACSLWPAGKEVAASFFEMSFVPRLNKLPAAQRVLWPKLKEVPRHFVLYGGTALALRLEHRISVDFDFFSSQPFVPVQLRGTMNFLATAEVLQTEPNTLTVSAPCPEPVKISFFGGLTLGRVREPEWSEDGVIQVASLLDVAACKMAVVQERAEAKDYLDVHAILKSGVTLPDMLGAAQAVYGEQFNAMVTLKALSYFKDGNLANLPDVVKKTLRDAAADVKEISDFARLPGGLTPEND